MAYTVPNFNMLSEIWHTPHKPASSPADVIGVRTQIYREPRDGSFFTIGERIIRVDPSTTALFPLTINDIYETPVGSNRWYLCQDVWIEHEGFPNQYVAAQVSPCSDTGALIAAHLP